MSTGRRSASSANFFSHPLRPSILVARENGLQGPSALLLSTLMGRLAWANYLRRRVPRRVVRARLDEHRRRDRTSRLVVSNTRSDYRAGVLVGVAPGERPGLIELIASLRRYEGHDIKIVVADDLTGEYPDHLVARDFPGVDFVRPLVASGTGICPFHTLQPALIHLVRRYGVPAVLKADPDTLVIGSGAFDIAIERFRSDPQLAALGRTIFDPSHPVDARWAMWMAHPEVRWSRRFRRVVRAAVASVPRLDFAQGGASFYSGPAVSTAVERGVLPYRQPQWSLQGNDVMLGLLLQAAGFSVKPFGPDTPISTGTDRLLFEPQELVERGVKVVHSVRGSPSGLDEDSIRGLFRAARDGGADSRVSRRDRS